MAPLYSNFITYIYTTPFALYTVIIIKGCTADPDLFPDESTSCSLVVCNHNNQNNTCCHSSTDNGSSLDTSTVVIFFLTTICSLGFLITTMYCCFSVKRKCTPFHSHARNRRREVSVSSAGVQTSASDLPPPYVWATESSDLAIVTIPRCPSYVKDPPTYSWTEREEQVEELQSDHEMHLDGGGIDFGMSEHQNEERTDL